MWATAVFLILAVAGAAGCRGAALRRSLAPDHAEFLLDAAGEALRVEDLKFEVRLRNRTGGEEARRTFGFSKRNP